MNPRGCEPLPPSEGMPAHSNTNGERLSTCAAKSCSKIPPTKTGTNQYTCFSCATRRAPTLRDCNATIRQSVTTPQAHLASHTCQATRTPSNGPCTTASHPCREHMMPSCPATTTACFYSLRGVGRGVENQHQSDVEQLTLTPPICNIIAAASQTAVGRGRQHGQC